MVEVAVDVDAPVLTERDGAVAADDDGAGELPSDAGSGDLGDVARSPLPGLLPRAGRTTFAYDAEVRLTRVTDAAGDVRAIDYYDDGSVEEKRWPFKNGDPITHRFGYDADGNLTSSTIADPLSDGGPAATSALTYDGHDRLVRLTQPGARRSPDAPTAIPDEVTVFGYDHNGEVLLRLLGDDDAAGPGIWDSRLFSATVEPLPSGWVGSVEADGTLRIGPEAWQRDGFWEEYFDGRPKAVEAFDRALTGLRDG